MTLNAAMPSSPRYFPNMTLPVNIITEMANSPTKAEKPMFIM